MFVLVCLLYHLFYSFVFLFIASDSYTAWSVGYLLVTEINLIMYSSTRYIVNLLVEFNNIQPYWTVNSQISATE